MFCLSVSSTAVTTSCRHSCQTLMLMTDGGVTSMRMVVVQSHPSRKQFSTRCVRCTRGLTAPGPCIACVCLASVQTKQACLQHELVCGTASDLFCVALNVVSCRSCGAPSSSSVHALAASLPQIRTAASRVQHVAAVARTATATAASPAAAAASSPAYNHIS